MDYLRKLITSIELHDVKGIRDCFVHDVNPNDTYNSEPLIYELTSEYTRSPRFKNCVKAFADAGLQMDDKILLAVLLDDAKALNRLLTNNPQAVQQEYILRCAYTPMYKVSLLHICAEFNHVASAKVLVKHGADINAKAGTDENGFGGQTPVFHTVNQNGNQSAAMLRFLLEQNAGLHITVAGLTWGRGYEWETFIPSVNPISYAMMGLLPQLHRDEKTVAATVSLLLKQAYGIEYFPPNIPNAYLSK
ncbi:MAG: ankyrin repeat domain-containing protein [Bacteroidota bacterium]